MRQSLGRRSRSRREIGESTSFPSAKKIHRHSFAGWSTARRDRACKKSMPRPSPAYCVRPAAYADSSSSGRRRCRAAPLEPTGVFTALPGALGCPSSRGWAPINNGISSTTRADLQSHFYVVGGNCSQSVVCVEQSSSQVKTNVRRAEQLTIKTRRSEISMMGSQAPPGQSSS